MNIDVFGEPDAPGQLPIPQDFDLACSVRGCTAEAAREIVSLQVDRFEDLVASAQEAANARSWFLSRRAGIQAELDLVVQQNILAGRIASGDGVTTSDQGTLRAREQLNTFFGSLE